jgi:mono/diheme cytochrome c family protein
MFKAFLTGVVIGVLLVAGGVYYYFASGKAPVATSAAPVPFERILAAKALHSYLEKLPHPGPQVPADEANLIIGAKVYKEQCAICHALPGEPQSTAALGMFPKPPELFHGIGVTDDDPWETYWKVENGIRLSGMPAFKGQLTEKQIWQVSMLVKNADKISDAVKKELAAGSSTPMSMAMPDTPSTPAPEAPKKK